MVISYELADYGVVARFVLTFSEQKALVPAAPDGRGHRGPAETQPRA